LPVWTRLWILFTVIWVIVAALNAGTIIAFSEGAEQEKALLPIAAGILVPAVLYGVGTLWALLRRNRGRGGE
jgi:hypothetical protein